MNRLVWDSSLRCSILVKFLVLPMQEFLRAAMNTGKEDDEKISGRDFITRLDEKDGTTQHERRWLGATQ